MKIKQFQEWRKDAFLGIFLAVLVLIKFWNSLVPKEKLFWGDDFVELSGMREHFYHQLQKGTLYLWDYLITTGMPYLGADSGAFYPIDLIIGLLAETYFVPFRLSLLHVIHFWLTGVFTYMYTRQLGLARTPALISSISFMFGGFMLGHSGHRNMIQTIAWFPLALYFLDKALLQKKIIWASLAGLVLAFSFLAGHANIFYFILLFILMYYCFRLFLGIKGRSLKLIFQDTFYFLITGFFLLGISSLQLFPTLGGNLESHQASLPYDWKIQGSFPIFNLIHFLFPDYSLWATSSPGEHYSYIGILPLLLSIWAIMRSKDARTRFFGLVILFSLFMAFGDLTPFYEFFYNHLPGVSLFRIPARINCLLVFSLSILAGIGCQQFLITDSNIPPKTWKALKAVHYLLGVGGIIIIIYLAFWLLPESQESNHQFSKTWGLLNKDFLFFLVLLGSSYLILLGRIKWGTNNLIKISMVLLISGDLVHEILPTDRLKEIPKSAHVIMEKIKKDPDLFRINNTEGVLPGLLRYQWNIFTYDTDSVPDYATRLIPDEALIPIFYSFKNPMLRDLLNVKYYIGSNPKMNNGWEKINIGGKFENNRELTLKDSTRISHLQLITFLAHSTSITQGASVAQVVLVKKDGTSRIVPIRAGIETAEWAIDRPGLECLHRKAPVKESWNMRKEGYHGHNYFFTADFPEPIEVSKIRLRYQAREGSLLIKKILVNDQEIEVFLKERFQLIEPNIYKNPSWLPRVFMIGRAKAITDKNELLEQLEQFDPREAVLLSELPQGYHEPLTPSFSNEEAEIIHYTPDNIKIVTKASEDKFLVLSDTYNPYWKATIDQKSSPILKVDYGLRGLYVPKGNHQIEFTFHFYPFYYGLTITGICLLVFFILSFGTIRRNYRKRERPSDDLKG